MEMVAFAILLREDVTFKNSNKCQECGARAAAQRAKSFTENHRRHKIQAQDSLKQYYSLKLFLD